MILIGSIINADVPFEKRGLYTHWMFRKEHQLMSRFWYMGMGIYTENEGRGKRGIVEKQESAIHDNVYK